MDDERFLLLAECLLEARKLSTWGPDFNDDMVIKAWNRKLEKFPVEIIAKAIDNLSGRKDFPCPVEIIDICNSHMRSSNKILETEKPWDPLVREIVKSDSMQALKISNLGDFHYIYDALLFTTGILKRNCDYELLRRFLSNPSQMIMELKPGKKINIF